MNRPPQEPYSCNNEMRRGLLGRPMIKNLMVLAALMGTLVGAASAQEQQPVIKNAGAYVPMPHAAVQPDKTHQYKAIFEAMSAAVAAEDIIPALEDAAALVNGLAAGAVPPANRRIAVVFYGLAAYGILDNETYRQKYGTDNPNLQVIAELRRAGVELFVCGQWLRHKNIEESKVISDVQIATDALIVLVAYQNRGYAHLID